MIRINRRSTDGCFTYTPEFKRNVRRLARRYRHVRLDLQPLIEQMETGEAPGDQIQGVEYTVYKVRLKSSDIQKGKSGGYRLIYWLKLQSEYVLLALYAKSDQDDIETDKLRRIIVAYEAAGPRNH